MAEYRRLSERRGIRPAEEALYEGVPDHIKHDVIGWIRAGVYERGYGVRSGKLSLIRSRLRLRVQVGADDRDHLDALLLACANDDDFCLEVIDLLLFLENEVARSKELMAILFVGGSAWTPSDDNRSLERRVDAIAKQGYITAASPTDAASDELRKAWAAAFGRDPDASDAWDHSIKAVEEILKPIVTPTQPGATLGSIVGQLRAQSSQYEVLLVDNGVDPRRHVDSVDALQKILHLIWPNPDRHGAGQSGYKRTPSLAEAQAVVQLAVLVVSWARAGIIRKK